MTDETRNVTTTPSGSQWVSATVLGGPPYWQLTPAGGNLRTETADADSPRGVAAHTSSFVAECAVCVGTIYRTTADGAWRHVRLIDDHTPRPLEEPA